MKRALFLIAILSITILTTGCINNLAIEELNNKAAEYMEKGDYPNAISRLEASIDLDNKIFETQYNLAVAYTENEDYDKAIELNKKSADAHYSLAVAYENYAKSLYKGETKKQKEASEEDNDEDSSVKIQFNEDGKYKATDEELELVKQYYNLAIENYTVYSQMNTSGKSFENIDEKVAELQRVLETLNTGNDTN